MNQEYLLKLQMLQQEAEKISQENESVSRQLSELTELKHNLNDFLLDKGDEAMVAVGKGIFAKAQLKEKRLYVNIGSGLVVKKDVPSTLTLIDEQLAKLEKIREEYVGQMEELNASVREIIDKQEMPSE